MAPRKPGDKWRASEQNFASKKRKKNENFEPEIQFLLRVPTHLAEQVRAHADATPEELEASGKKMSIDFDEQFRHVKVDLNGTHLKGRVVDLPCIIEAHKTVDKRTVYKTNDISQLVICEEVPPPDGLVPGTAVASSGAVGESIKPDAATSSTAALADGTVRSSALNSSSKTNQWPHGITPPMRNVRKRRFRRTLLQRDVEVNGLERELRRIIQQDNEAVSFSWKIVYDDSDGQQKTQVAGRQSANAAAAEDDGTAGSSRLDDDSAAANADGMDGDMLNDDSNLSLSSGDSEHLDPETKARLKRLAEENRENLSRDLFGDYASSSSEDGEL